MALSLHVARLASSAGLEALQPGALVPAAVKAVEDHGYSLSFGIKVGGAVRLGCVNCRRARQADVMPGTATIECTCRTWGGVGMLQRLRISSSSSRVATLGA